MRDGEQKKEVKKVMNFLNKNEYRFLKIMVEITIRRGLK
jgi:hypothetical protein